MSAGDCGLASQREAALRIAQNSRCPSNSWHAALEGPLSSPEMTMVSVGANKGYGVLELLSRYTATNVTGVAWQQLLQTSSRSCGRCCGICNDCFQRHMQGTTTQEERAHRKVRVHAFEVLPANAALLRTAASHFGLPIEVHEMAASNSTRILQLGGHYMWRSRNQPGYECATLDFQPAAGGHRPRPSDGAERRARRAREDAPSPVQATTLDDFFARRGIERVHVLEIDANGMDALVLEGAAATLARRGIDLLTFEYHEAGFWGACGGGCRTLRGVLAWLEGAGYACYWQGAQGGVARASGRCWQEDFEFRRWSNLVCTHRAPLLETLERLPMTPLKLKQKAPKHAPKGRGRLRVPDARRRSSAAG